MSRNFDRAQEMVVASMEYIKVLGFRIRRTEVQRDVWKQVAQSHDDEVIKLRQHVDALKAERDAAKQEAVSARQDAVTRAEADRKRIDGLMIQVQDMRAEIERLKKPRQHPVKAGEYVRRLTGFNTTPAGEIAQVIRVHVNADSVEYDVLRPNGETGTWIAKNCAPCDPPEATHITPDGKATATAQAAVTPQPGDVVRLVRVPTVKDCSKYDFQDSEQLRLISTQVNTMGKVVVTELCEACACVVDDTGTIKAWPLSCVEVVKGGDK